MTFAVSPSVTVREIDLTTVVPAVSSTEGALAGVFRWGPVDKRILVDSEVKLVKRFARPTNYNPETWFTAANFLAYGNKLYISRAADVTGNNISQPVSFTADTWEASNNVLVLANATDGNTGGLLAGMYLAWSNDAYAPIGATIASVNTISVVMSDAPSTNIAGAEYEFREDVDFSAVALQGDLNYNIADITDHDEQTIKNDEQ